MILTGVPIYLIFVYWKNKPKFVKDGLKIVTELTQKMLLVLPKD